MSDALQGILLLVASAAVLAVPAHLLMRRLLGASVLSGTAASVMLQVLDVLHSGHADEFLELSLLVGAFWGTIVAMGVGLLLRRAFPAGPRKGWAWDQ